MRACSMPIIIIANLVLRLFLLHSIAFFFLGKFVCRHTHKKWFKIHIGRSRSFEKEK